MMNELGNEAGLNRIMCHPAKERNLAGLRYSISGDALENSKTFDGVFRGYFLEFPERNADLRPSKESDMSQ